MVRPFALMIAGPNGAGKTTLTTHLREERGVEFGKYINPDDIALLLPGSYEERVRAAQLEADRLRNECIVSLTSFSFETVMSHSSKLETLRQAKEAGFTTRLYFVGTDDPSTNIARVLARVAQGGHDVPQDKIRDRWLRSMEYLHEAMSIAEVSFVFDNSSISAGPRLILKSQLVPEFSLSINNQTPLPAWVTRFALMSPP